MAKKIKVCGCPCCGAPAYWRIGNRNTKTPDMVQCLECFLELEGTFEPQSALEKWNFRVLDHLVQSRMWNINGELCE